MTPTAADPLGALFTVGVVVAAGAALLLVVGTALDFGARSLVDAALRAWSRRRNGR